MEWLWPERIPLGKLTLLVGDGGVGKSTLTAHIAARVTTGEDWPDAENSQDAARVLLITGEDGVADTIVPRLTAAGANLDLVLHKSQTRDPMEGETRLIDLSRDLGSIRDVCDTYENMRLIIIDPVSAFFGHGNPNRDTDVRQVLEPLAQLAEELGVAVLIVAHVNKSSQASAQHRVSGSTGFVNVVRKAWFVGTDPNDPDRRLLVWLKGNIGRRVPGLAFTIADDGETEQSRIVWDTEEVHVSADQLLSPVQGTAAHARPPRAGEAVRNWLMGLLRDGPVLSSTVERESAKLGYSESTV